MKIACLVSGGVDSSTALHLLEEQDYDVTAFYLRIWLEDDISHLGDCPWKEDLDFIREVCKRTGVNLEVLDFKKHYHERVVQAMLDEVRAGRTPNPDIWCNNRIKFGLFAEEISGYDKIASGHYAQLAEVGGKPLLKQAPDPVKDQTYFLSHLPQKTLGNLMFPIGHMNKDEVRETAVDMALPNAGRKDSQGICFLGQFKYRDFVKHYLGIRPGKFVEFETGDVVGNHQGYWFHTIGQRKGIGLSGGPWYVVSKDIGENVVHISRRYHRSHLKRNTFDVQNCNWYVQPEPGQLLHVKLRHGPDKHRCVVNPVGESAAIMLEDNDQGIASGQFAAFYDNDLCLGSGIIK